MEDEAVLVVEVEGEAVEEGEEVRTMVISACFILLFLLGVEWTPEVANTWFHLKATLLTNLNLPFPCM